MKRYFVRGEWRTIREIAGMAGAAPSTIYARIYAGWTGDDLSRSAHRPEKRYLVRGEWRTVKEIADMAGVHLSTIYNRIYRGGWTGDDLLKPPKLQAPAHETYTSHVEVFVWDDACGGQLIRYRRTEEVYVDLDEDELELLDEEEGGELAEREELPPLPPPEEMQDVLGRFQEFLDSRKRELSRAYNEIFFSKKRRRKD